MKTKRENIAEYILYMWQMEDVVRAFKDDPAMQQNEFLSDLNNMMRTEGVLDKGHVQVVLNALSEVEELHNELLDTEATYKAAYLQLLPQLTLLKSKSDNPTQSDISMMFVFLYSILLLKIKKKEISQETIVVQQQVSHLLAYLSKTYKANIDAERGE